MVQDQETPTGARGARPYSGKAVSRLVRTPIITTKQRPQRDFDLNEKPRVDILEGL